MRKLKILIVEDELLIAEEIRAHVEAVGHAVTASVATARAAIAAVAADPPDLVLMDIRLKGEEDGIDAATVIGERANVPIVFTTAHSDKSTIERAMLTRPFGYVVKPIREADLVAAIQTAVLRHAAEERLRASDDQFHAIVARTTDLVVQFLVDGRLLTANPVCRDALGYSPSQICRLSLCDLIAAPDLDRLPEMLHRALAGAAEVEFPVALRTRAGAAIPVRAVLGKRQVGGTVDRLWALFQPAGAAVPAAHHRPGGAADGSAQRMLNS
jgi:PAS domain S-box-containing protein